VRKLDVRCTYKNELHGKKCRANHGETIIIMDMIAFHSTCFVSVVVLCFYFLIIFTRSLFK